jgi:hypothetical protein
MSDAIKTQGTTLHYSPAGSPTSFTLVGNILDINGLDGSLTIIDSSDLDSTAAEKIAGLVDEGNVSFTLKLNPNNAVHQALRDARYSGGKLEWKITIPSSTPVTIIFYGYVVNFPINVPFNDKITTPVTIAITGRAVWA